ncbi:extracellular solute-binding protein [Chloroflexi bacterium TSY]|nr:extracellular solute-binding protein [Chloroflexi bacterium TSY]
MNQHLSRRQFLHLSGTTVLGAALLAACQPASIETGASDGTQATGERVTIEFLGMPGSPDLIPEEQELFHDEHPDVEWALVQQAQGTSRLEQLMSLVAAGTPPDTARVESDVYRTFAHLGLLLPITSYIDADAEFSKDDYWIQPQESDRQVYQGESYGIGSCWVAPHFYYNASLFEELEVEPPSNHPDEAWDWNQFLEIATQLTVDVNGHHPGDSGFDATNVERWGVNWPTWWIPLHAAVQSNSAAWVDGDSQQIVLDDPNAMDAMQRIADLRLVHQVMPRAEALEALGMGGAQLLETKKVALVVDGSWALSWLWQIEGGIGTGVLPTMTRPGTDMQAHLVTIVKDTEYPDAAWELIRFLSSPWYQERYCRSGLWLPSQTALMTDESIADWCVEPEHPAGYELIVTEYAPKYGHYLTMPVGYRKAADTALQPIFDQIFNGDAKAEDVLPNAVAEANEIMVTEQQRPTS